METKYLDDVLDAFEYLGQRKVPGARAELAGIKADNEKLRGNFQRAVNDLKTEHTKLEAALKEAAKILWFDDNSDYGNALWKIVELLGGEEKVKLLEDGNDDTIEKWLWPEEEKRS